MHIPCRDLKLEIFKENDISMNLKEKYMKFININNLSNILKYDSMVKHYFRDKSSNIKYYIIYMLFY